MSRIIVKNLPKKVTSKKLQDVFSSKGCITDFQLKYTKDGVFRQFAFIGYKTEEEAKAAEQYFNNTFIDTSRIQVEICAKLGDTNKPRAWSKHAKEKLITEQKDEKGEVDKQDKSKKKKKKKKDKSNEKDKNELETFPDEHKKKKKDKSNKKDDENVLETFPDEFKNDALFAEFLEVNKPRTSKPLWTDAALELGDDKEDDKNETSDSDDESGNEKPDTKQKNISDLDYLKSKMKESSISEEKLAKPSAKNVTSKKVDKPTDNSFTVKLRNLPYRCNKKQIKQFFQSLKIKSLRIPPKLKGFAYVQFKTERDMKLALNKHKCVLDGHKVEVVKYEKKELETIDKSKPQFENKEKSGEEIAESGRIFIRNLCFSATENEIQNLFSKYGPISEIHCPIDAYTKKGLGFAFVTFLFPEHAIKAFTELDGSIFQGRVLHLIPAKPKIEIPIDENESSYKKKKEAKLKALSGSSHNWNTLFLGVNAVADAISKKYDIDKSQLLTDESKESVAVRMALGETQLVVETRKFLIQNGVKLDAFSQAACERSKTVILAKNLPANTSSNEVSNIFSKHGTVSRVVLPPDGITALVEFQEPTEAKLAFKRLAYTRFRYMPLYLEWAPINVFSEDAPKTTTENELISETNNQNNQVLDSKLSKENKVKDDDDDEEDDSEPEPGSVLFIKNLNFETTEESLQKHFKNYGTIHSVSISKKNDLNTGKLLSMGFGFIHFKKKSSATRALNDLQNSMLDDHKLELKFSNKATILKAETYRRKSEVKKQKTTKILIRNIPFEVTKKEIKDLFKEFGMLKSVRLPMKPSGENCHRGFGFVDFCTKSEAKKAFDALCHSTHLLGRRLVLEWANPESEEVSELRKKTAKDFYVGGPRTKLKKSKFLQDVAMAGINRNQDDEEEDND